MSDEPVKPEPPTVTDGTPVEPPFGGKWDDEPHKGSATMNGPANPSGLTKPTAVERAANAEGRLPDLMSLLAKVAKVERSLTHRLHGIEPTFLERRSGEALRRLTNHAVRECAASLQEALVMHPERKVPT